MQDFRELNQNSHIDKYSMKEITECIGDIGWANSTIFTTLDLTSGFWQMQLDEDSQKLTADHFRQRPISLDHAHGTFGLPGKLPMINGRGAKGHSQCTGLPR